MPLAVENLNGTRAARKGSEDIVSPESEVSRGRERKQMKIFAFHKA